MREHTTKKEIELLAPAGSYETFQAVIRAGADAVYLGGSEFGARAYADNFCEAELLKAIDYAHIHGRAVYLTINTLFKEEELGRLYDYLLSYYRQGLDAVIVQDIGALAFLHREFPGLAIHASTQMSVTGAYGAAYVKSLGADRVVTARELSLAEIRKIHETVDIEIESFVHGALCYCYSGQCLFSSILGGRSGNRGRCAQPCRLPYEVFDKNMRPVTAPGSFVLSPKDLCTIANIPELAENGIYSFKIEGRMKQAEYAAGVVSVYRSYIDGYRTDFLQAKRAGKSVLQARTYAKERYQVLDADMKKLLDLGNRSGFTDGYYNRKNGKEMITFGKPGHAKSNESLQREIRERYVSDSGQIKEKINGILRLKKDFPAIMEVSCGTHTVRHEGAVVQAARKQPLTADKVEAAIKKTGNTPFLFEALQVDMDTDIFLPVQALKELRRAALAAIEEERLARLRRTIPDVHGSKETHTEKVCGGAGRVVVSVEDRGLKRIVLERAFVDDIYYDSSAYDRAKLLEDLGADVLEAHTAGKLAYYVLPAVFRGGTAEFYRKNAQGLSAVGLDGVVVKSLDAAAFVKEHLCGKMSVILDHSLYSWNRAAKEVFDLLDPIRDTVPLELNRRELSARDNRGSEIVLYGNLPLMTTAQCVHANIRSCDRQPSVTYLKDRYGKYFPVKNNCAECYNTIYNAMPLMLFDCRMDLTDMGMAAYRLSFTTEKIEQAERVLNVFEETFLTGKKQAKEMFLQEYTNGHYKRGVE